MNTEHRSVSWLAIIVGLIATTTLFVWICSAPWWIVPLAVVGEVGAVVITYFDKTDGGSMWSNAGDGGGFGDGGGC